jgi:hypothetical protein
MPANVSNDFQCPLPTTAETALAQCPAEFRPLVQRDFNAAWTTIGTATVDGEARKLAWVNWSRYAQQCRIDPWMRHFHKSLQQSYLLAFASRVRTGVFGRAIPVGFQSVEKALRHVAQTLVLAGFDDPRRTYGSKELDLPFRHLLKGYREQDPAPQPQLALPVITIERAGAYHQAPQTPLTRATADLVTIAFFFLLRVGEYTMPRRNVRTRTEQFRVQDVTFRHNGLVLPTTSPLDLLLRAESVTLYLDNQKNGQRGATIHHTACPSWFCPVKALARRVAHIVSQGCAPTTPLSYVGPGTHVIAKNVKALVHRAAVETNLPAQGYDLHRIGTHSLRASGAMALKLQGTDDSLIMKIGRWTGLTFLTYIHAQIGALNTGLAQRMTTRIHFVNVAG